MADNVTINASSGTALVACDEVVDGTLGTVEVQYVKIMDGTLNGTNKATVSASGGLQVDGSAVTQPVSGTVSVNTHAVTQSGTWTVQPGNTANTTAWKVDGSSVTQPVSAASLPLPSGAATSAKQPALGAAGAASADVLTVQGIASMTALKVDGSGITQPVSGTFWQATQPVSGTVSANASQTGTWTVQPGNTQNSTAWLVTEVPATTGGLSFYSGTIGATATTVKASAGQLYGYDLYNSNAAAVYVQIFNKLVGSVTLGTTAPDMVIVLPPTSGRNVSYSAGIAMGTGIAFACTTTRTGSTAPTSTIDINIFFK